MKTMRQCASAQVGQQVKKQQTTDPGYLRSYNKMEPRSNIEKPKERKVKRQKNQKTEDMEIIEIKKDQQAI